MSRGGACSAAACCCCAADPAPHGPRRPISPPPSSFPPLSVDDDVEGNSCPFSPKQLKLIRRALAEPPAKKENKKPEVPVSALIVCAARPLVPVDIAPAGAAAADSSDDESEEGGGKGRDGDDGPVRRRDSVFQGREWRARLVGQLLAWQSRAPNRGVVVCCGGARDATRTTVSDAETGAQLVQHCTGAVAGAAAAAAGGAAPTTVAAGTFADADKKLFAFDTRLAVAAADASGPSYLVAEARTEPGAGAASASVAVARLPPARAACNVTVGPIVGRLRVTAPKLPAAHAVEATVLLEVDGRADLVGVAVDVLLGETFECARAGVEPNTPTAFVFAALRCASRYRVAFRGVANGFERTATFHTPQAGVGEAAALSVLAVSDDAPGAPPDEHNVPWLWRTIADR